MLLLLGEVGSAVVAASGDELDLFLHDLLVGANADEVSVGRGIGGLAAALVLSGAGEGVDGVAHFLLAERELVVAFSGLDAVDVVVLSLLVADREDEGVDVVNKELSR